MKLKPIQSLWRWLPAGLGGVLAGAGLYGLSAVLVAGADSPAQGKPAKPAKPATKKLSGAELYAIHCNRCHAERYATERTDAQWKTIMLHMQTRAQLPGKDAKAILKYLQENN